MAPRNAMTARPVAVPLFDQKSQDFGGTRDPAGELKYYLLPESETLGWKYRRPVKIDIAMACAVDIALDDPLLIQLGDQILTAAAASTAATAQYSWVDWHPSGPWMATGSSQRLYFWCPAAYQFSEVEIAESLSRINRWLGHTLPYSVAQHSINVARRLPPRLRLAGLLHDAHEAFTGDITSPLRAALSFDARADIDAIRTRIQRAIHLQLQVPILSQSDRDAIAAADRAALATEIRDLLPDPPDPELAEVMAAASGPRLRPMPWPAAVEAWLDEFATAVDLLGFGRPKKPILLQDGAA